MKKMNSLCLMAGLSVLLWGCGGGGGDDLNTADNSPQTPPTIQSTSATVVAGEGKTLTIAATGSGLSFTISQPPNQGLASISSSGVLTYIPNNNPTSASDSVSVTASNSLGSATATVQFTLQSDPLSPYQWHLINTGQDAFSTTKPTTGNDLNVKEVWASGITGKGVIVNVVDSGLEIAHPDLAGNVSNGDSVNFGGGNDPTNTTSTTGDHGTGVAGLISSVAGNGVGGKGVAYGAKIMGHNFLEHQTAENIAAAFGGIPGSAKAHIFNASFGLSACIFSTNIAENTAFSNVKTLRSGKGGLIVKSAGNGFKDPNDPNNIYSPSKTGCGFSLVPSISNGNAAFDQANVVDNVIVVAAVNANGKKSSYSTTGANIWISGIGGEYGWDAKTLEVDLTPLSAEEIANAPQLQPAMVTTDQSGCTKGKHIIKSDSNKSFNEFEKEGSVTQTSKNINCDYTSTFNGTSSAAPTVSGVIALMLEANPNLTWRDVKHILAMTAKQVDANFSPIVTTSANAYLMVKNGQTVEQGWVKNNAGYLFHNWYGFGLVDAGKAVEMAKTFKSLPVQTSQTVLPKTQLLSTEQNVNSQSANLTTVETVELSLLAGDSYYTNNPLPTIGCLQFELTSPQGTKSILLNGGSGFWGWIQPEIKFLSNAFYGENGQGVWNIALKNICTSGNVYLPNANPTLIIRGR